jgi:hypothetical protein
MDTGALVEGGVAGLRKIVAALEREGVTIAGAYLIRTTSLDDESHRTDLRIVTEDDAGDVLLKFVRLRAEGRLPVYSGDITLTPVSPEDYEASRVLDYARQVGKPTVAIHGVPSDGLFIEDAVVVRYPHEERAVA